MLTQEVVSGLKDMRHSEHRGAHALRASPNLEASIGVGDVGGEIDANYLHALQGRVFPFVA